MNACPVCNTVNNTEITSCHWCGWDLRPVYGLSSAVQDAYHELLKKAKAEWEASVDLPRDARAPLFETEKNHTLPDLELKAAGYRDNRDGTVTDLSSGLTWLRFAVGQQWHNGTVMGEADRYTWDEAFKAVKLFNRDGGCSGKKDWRLPTIKELRTLIIDGCMPTVDQNAFPNCPADVFWSSSASEDCYRGAWCVSFAEGDVEYWSDDFSLMVRLVRRESRLTIT